MGALGFYGVKWQDTQESGGWQIGATWKWCICMVSETLTGNAPVQEFSMKGQKTPLQEIA
jgi:hypothetical protein